MAEYVDIFSPEMMEHTEVLGLITRRNIPLPLICVDGTPRLVGGISLEMVSAELGKLGLVPRPDEEAQPEQ